MRYLLFGTSHVVRSLRRMTVSQKSYSYKCPVDPLHNRPTIMRSLVALSKAGEMSVVVACVRPDIYYMVRRLHDFTSVSWCFFADDPFFIIDPKRPWPVRRRTQHCCRLKVVYTGGCLVWGDVLSSTGRVASWRIMYIVSVHVLRLMVCEALFSRVH